MIIVVILGDLIMTAESGSSVHTYNEANACGERPRAADRGWPVASVTHLELPRICPETTLVGTPFGVMTIEKALEFDLA